MELAVSDPKVCHSCSTERNPEIELTEVVYTSLFRDVGYGAATRIRYSLCNECYAIRELSRETLNPRVYD